MNLPELCIRRPVMTTLLTAALCIFGIVAFRLLPVNDLPNVDFPTIVVTANLPGATAETMASAVAKPLEQQFATIAGIDSITSTSTLGSSQVTLQFSLERNIDAAAQDVQTAIAAVQRRLPSDMPVPPSFRKTNPADSPILYLALSSPVFPLSQVDDLAQTILVQRISTIDGVAQVQVYGSQKYAIRVELDPLALASRGITLDEVRTALASNNVNLPTGILDGHSQTLTVVADGQLKSTEAFGNIIVTYRNEAPVRLRELGTINDSVQENRVASWFFKYGQENRAVVLAVQRQPGTNTVEIVDRIRALLPQFREQLPAAVNLEILNDRSASIRESVHDVESHLLMAIVLVILVIFLFLRNLRATFIPATAIPLALLGTFVVMYFYGFTLDNLSLLALTLSVGFVVDDAIVMLENIVRHIERGMPVREAALKGSREIGFTIISMTLSLVAVFIPILFMQGILGRLLHEFAITISAAILVSGLISLTLTPMLCSRFLRDHKAESAQKHGRLYRAIDGFLDGMRNLYKHTLLISLRHKVVTLAIAGLMVVLTIIVGKALPQGFIPTDDIGQIFVFTEASQDISFDAMAKHQQEATAIVAKNPNIESFMSAIGGGGSSSSINNGRIIIRLKPREERIPAEKIVAQLRKDLAGIPGLKVFPQIPPSIRLGGQRSNSPYQFSLSSSDLDELYAAARTMESLMQAQSELIDVSSNLQITSPEARITINRDRAAVLGITAQQIEDALYSAYGSRQVSTLYTPTDQYYVIMELQPQFQRNTEALALIRLKARNGNLVPLDAVTSMERNVGPLTVNHVDQLPSVTISFNLRPEYSLGEATQLVSALARSHLPGTVSYSFQGSAQAFTSSLAGLGLLLFAAILVIYIVLGILYEDFIHPITILSGLPAASFGALFTLWCFNEELNIMGYVGVILLIGIVKKNAIMMIDFAISARNSGDTSDEHAIFEACMVRFRPIMMTTFAAMAGALPIALGLGAGADSRRSLGLAVVGGLVVSQLLTLYITPVIYIYLERLFKRNRKRRMIEIQPVLD